MCACFQETYFLNTQVFIERPGKRRSETELSALTVSHLLSSEYSTLPSIHGHNNLDPKCKGILADSSRSGLPEGSTWKCPAGLVVSPLKLTCRAPSAYCT